MAGFLNGTDPGLRQTRTPTRQILTNGSGFTANSSTTIALTNDPGTEDHVQISFDGIIQHHSTYTVSGTTVTFDAVIPAGVAEIEASFVVTVSSITVPDSSVSTSKIVDANVTEAKLQDNSVSLSKMASGTDGNIISFDSSGNPVAIATGTDGQVLTSAGAGAQPAFETLPAGGKVVQVVNTSTGAYATGTTTIPCDDTIPQKTEGTEFMTLAITPTSSSNKLIIRVQYNFGTNVVHQHTAALFQDDTANALASTAHYPDTATGTASVIFSHYMTAGTTSATTFKVRAGSCAAGSSYFNGSGAGRLHGGVNASGITITEISA